MQAGQPQPSDPVVSPEGTSPTEPRDQEQEAEATTAARQRLAKMGRNDPCPCGSGRKYKKCCLPKDEALELQAIEAERVPQLPPAPAWTSPANVPQDQQLGPEPEPEPLRLFDTHTESGDDIPPEVDEQLEQIWDDFEKLEHPNTAEMDALLDKLLALPPQATVWSEVFQTFARNQHPDLPGIFRRITSVVPHSRKAGLGYLYWAAAEEFSRRGWRELLPEVAAGLRRFDAQNYDADILRHIEYFLLADGLDAEALALNEYFLPIMRQDEGLMPYAVPNLAERILQIRLGRLLQEDRVAEPQVETIARRLCAGMEEEFDFGTVRFLAAVAAGQALTEPLEREDFELNRARNKKQERPPEEAFRVSGALLRTAQEAYRTENVPPGCGYVALILMTESLPDRKAPANQGKKLPWNLLDYLRPADLEERLVRSSRDLIGINAPKARLVLQGHELLLHLAQRHQFVSAEQADNTEKTLARLKAELQRL